MEDLLQPNFDFETSKNQLIRHLKKAEFISLFEVKTPPRNSEDFDSAVKSLRSMEMALHTVKGLHTGIAILDKPDSVSSWNVANFAAAGLSTPTLDNNIVYVSGKAETHSNMCETIKQCYASGLRNIVPVTGDGYASPQGAASQKDQHCLDAVHSLQIIQTLHEAEGIHPGAVVNPFKYSSLDIFPQYFKLIKKINFGAKFIVTQAGWDMMKLQELRWFLDLREFHVPTIARLILLTPDLVEKILKGEYPGVYISRDFQDILEKENRYGFKQFASAQWRRLQLQVAGCRLMGYSGVQICGIERPEHISTAAVRIKEALKEFNDFSSWNSEYMRHISRADMAPFEHRFYLYKNLMRSPYIHKPEVNSDGILPCSLWDKLHYHLCKSMFAKDHNLAPDEHLLSKKIFTGCSSCSYCRLPMTHYICPEQCPKGLSNGPCGGSRVNELCEVMDKQCIHIKRTKRAAWLNEIDLLEEEYIKHPDMVSKVKK